MIADTPPPFLCRVERISDGDTFRCAGVRQRIRIANIDAPELPGHCRAGRRCAPGDAIASTNALRVKLRGRVYVYPSGFDRYGRIVARVIVNGRDVGEEMVRGGYAVRWPR